MVSVRRSTVHDLFEMQTCNLTCLPENYQIKYYEYHALSWPQLLHVAENASGKVVGYVLAKLEEEDQENHHGHITSIAVRRTHRKMGLAKQLMCGTHNSMKSVFNCSQCSLHVRVSNRAACSLYRNALDYRKVSVEHQYYADKEDAFNMRKIFTSAAENQPPEADKSSDPLNSKSPNAETTLSPTDGSATPNTSAMAKDTPASNTTEDNKQNQKKKPKRKMRKR